VTQSNHAPAFEKEGLLKVLLDHELPKIQQMSTVPVEHILQPEHALYVIYTSGTTGQPKGVVIEHRNVVRLFQTDQPLFDFGPDDVWTLFHSYCFDFSVWEMYGALLFGGRLVIVPKDITRDARRYAVLLTTHQVTVLNQTPGAFYALQDYYLPQNTSTSIRYVIFGGEALAPQRLSPWKKRYPNCQLINMYGITETTVHVTYKAIEMADIEAQKSNIGRPIPTLECYVLNPQLQLLPIGWPGEIYVSGAGLARAYLHREALSTERFLPNPFVGEPKSRMYKTGDLAKWLPNGELEYLGRKDQQVKIRGHRIELGEVQNCLEQSVLVEQAVVRAQKDQTDRLRLIAYIIPHGVYDSGAIRDYLSEALPQYMIPSILVEMDQFPLTVNGKIDHKALPSPDLNQLSSQAYLAPQNLTEEILVNIWQELLGIQQVGITDNFFELGGHSLLGMQMVAAIQKQLGKTLKVSDVFLQPNIEELAQLIEQTETKTDWPAIQALPRPEQIPLSFAQERLWFIDQLEGSIAYHQPTILQLTGQIDPLLLEQALIELLERHEVLRMVIRSTDGTPQQIPLAAQDWRLAYSDWPRENHEMTLEQYMQTIISAPFDLSTD
ncbi:MAG: amino acid adenylation domain-containing protein, partial [Bacteroidota bacterium]